MKNQILQGDCLELMKDIPDNHIDLIVIDPPYNIKKADWDKWKTVESYVEWMGLIFLECQRILKDNGSFYFFHNDFLQIVELQNFLNKNTEFVFKNLITIDKINEPWVKVSFGIKNKFRKFINFAEYCLFYTFQFDEKDNILQKNNKIFQYLDDELEKSGTHKYISKILGNGMVHHYFGFSKKDKSQFRFPTKQEYLKLQKTGNFLKEYDDLRYTFNKKEGLKNVWKYTFTFNKKYIVSTQKPIKLMEDIVKYSSNEGDLVLDCFMGSGTTGVACKNLNRNFIGMEKNEEYFKISNERINNTNMLKDFL